jgi:GAF domain-containing protein
MDSVVPNFDAPLMALLAREAFRAEETVEAFVGRAVSARLVQLLDARQDPTLAGLLDKLSTAQLIAPEMPEFDRELVLRNPIRLRVLADTGLLETPPPEHYDRLVGIAAEALSAPIAAVVLISHDFEVFLSAVGLPEEVLRSRSISLQHSISQYVVTSGTPLVIEDARADATFHNHPVVLGGSLVAYLGMPLTNAAGHTIGTLCVGDRRPRRWRNGHVQILQDLAEVVGSRVFGDASHPGSR